MGLGLGEQGAARLLWAVAAGGGAGNARAELEAVEAGLLREAGAWSATAGKDQEHEDGLGFGAKRDREEAVWSNGMLMQQYFNWWGAEPRLRDSVFRCGGRRLGILAGRGRRLSPPLDEGCGAVWKGV